MTYIITYLLIGIALVTAFLVYGNSRGLTSLDWKDPARRLGYIIGLVLASVAWPYWIYYMVREIYHNFKK